MICRGVRRFNRDVKFNAQNPNRSRLPTASISALHFIPPTIDLAKLAAAYRSADRWADRMQVALHENQQAFEQQRRAIETLHNKARK